MSSEKEVGDESEESDVALHGQAVQQMHGGNEGESLHVISAPSLGTERRTK